MGQKDVDLVLGRCMTDPQFGREFCEKLAEVRKLRGDTDAQRKSIRIFLNNKLKLHLSPHENDFFIEGKGQVPKDPQEICSALEKCREILKMKYEYSANDDDPKRC